MPNRNYKNGSDFERKVVKFFESKGYLAARSAGSHGMVDVIAIPKFVAGSHGDMPVLVQCKKTGKISKSDLEDLKKADHDYIGWFLLCENWKGKPLFHDLKGEVVEI